jgi:hypothetical protein
MDDASYSTNVDIGTSMIIDALNVNGAVGFEHRFRRRHRWRLCLRGKGIYRGVLCGKTLYILYMQYVRNV